MKLIDADRLVERVRKSADFSDLQKFEIIMLIKREDEFLPPELCETEDDCVSDIEIIDRQIKHVVSESKYASENVENCGSALAGLSDSLCRLIKLKRSIISKEIGE